MIFDSGVQEGTMRAVDPAATGCAVLLAMSRFHHPAHAAEWGDPTIDAAFDNVWQLLMNGLCVATGGAVPPPAIPKSQSAGAER